MGRIGAFSGNANWNAACIGFALPILFNAYQHHAIKGWAALLCAIPLVWGLFAAASVTGLFAAGLGLLVYFAAGTPAMLLRFGLPVVLLGGLYLGTGMPLPKTFEQRVGSALAAGNISAAGTFEGRTALVKEAWKTADDTVLVGLGADGFRKASIHGMPVHVFPLLLLTEGGIWSVIGLAVMILTLAVIALRMLRFDRSDAAMALAILTVLAVFMFAIPHMYARMWIGPLMLALGVGLAAAGSRGAARPAPRPLGRKPRQV
jgi:membrane protein insertase Oxa1/YidC/SpoIIIJ